MKTGRDAKSQANLALCCEANGLEAERNEHLALAVLTDPANVTARVHLDPGRDAVWKRPGCKKVSGRWLSDTQIVAD